MVTPLRKISLKGRPYVRREEVEAEIGQLLTLPVSEVVARCALKTEEPGWVSTEALLYVVRARRGTENAHVMSSLFNFLSTRVLSALPKADAVDRSDLSKEKIRDRVYDRFVDLLLGDQSAYDDRLDYFEINFNDSLARLRLTAQKQVWREENRSETLEAPDDPAALSAEVEQAVGSYDPLSAEALDDARYRSRLDAAIDNLTPLQRRIVEMLRQGIPIDSKDASAVTISGVLDKAEKTVRNQRDKAFARLRIALTAGRAI